MADPKFRALMLKLLERTKEGKVEWEATAAEGVYQAAFPQYSVKIFCRPRPDVDDVDYVLQVADDQGQVIDEMWDTNPVETNAMRDLFNCARSIGLGLDRALDSLLAALDSDEPPPPTEPKEPSEPPEITDEDVPF